MGQPAEVLRDDDSEWGKSRVDYAFEQRMRRKMLARMNRAAWLTRNVQPRERGRFTAKLVPVVGEVFVSASGIKAYRTSVVRKALPPGTSIHDETSRYQFVSLPFVSIQHQEAK